MTILLRLIMNIQTHFGHNLTFRYEQIKYVTQGSTKFLVSKCILIHHNER